MLRHVFFLICLTSSVGAFADSTYHHFDIREDAEKILGIDVVAPAQQPRWARSVSQSPFQWSRNVNARPFFDAPIPFVRSPADIGEPFYPHNHVPALTWLPNGDLLAIWYSTRKEVGGEMTILASRLRAGQRQWDPSSEFFKGEGRNMTGSSLFYDADQKILYHFNGVGRKNVPGFRDLAMLMRTSRDNGQTWSVPSAISPKFQRRNQVIAGTFKTRAGKLIQLCDASEYGAGGSVMWLSSDAGKTWTDTGSNIAGIHARTVELRDGSFLALGRQDNIQGKMPLSLSADSGRSWSRRASPFLPINWAQRLALLRLHEGVLLMVSFSSSNFRQPKLAGVDVIDNLGRSFTGYGLYAALSFDEGKTWPLKKLLTPGKGSYSGGDLIGNFTATPTNAEPGGYLDMSQSPDGVIHLISSNLYYRFNYAWLLEGTH